MINVINIKHKINIMNLIINKIVLAHGTGGRRFESCARKSFGLQIVKCCKATHQVTIEQDRQAGRANWLFYLHPWRRKSGSSGPQVGNNVIT